MSSRDVAADPDQERVTGVTHLGPSYDGQSFGRDTLDVTGGSYGRVMEAHVIPLHPTVRLEGDRIVIEGLSISDQTLAAFLGERPAAEREALAERALRIGLLALQDVGVTVNVDAVRTEFDRMMRQAEQVNERAATALEQTLRANFADGDGRLPRTLEKFLGDRGALRSMVDELFDEKKRDSAIGRIGTMLERYFDGDASKLAHLLDPTRLNSPMHQFRQEIAAGFKGIEERLVAIEAAAAARGAERARSAAKGIDFEDLLDGMLGDIARGSGDMVDRTALEAGTLMRSKKGDFVLTIDPTITRGCDLRVVIEAKDRPMSTRQMRDELREAREKFGEIQTKVQDGAKYAMTTTDEYVRSNPWRAESLGPDVFDKLASAIVAFEMPVERIEGKFKLGQNRSREDRSGVLAGLDGEGTSDAELLARFIREHAGV